MGFYNEETRVNLSSLQSFPPHDVQRPLFTRHVPIICLSIANASRLTFLQCLALGRQMTRSCDPGSGDGEHLLEYLMCFRHLIIYDVITANKPVLEDTTNPNLPGGKTETLKRYSVDCSFSPGGAMSASDDFSFNDLDLYIEEMPVDHRSHYLDYWPLFQTISLSEIMMDTPQCFQKIGIVVKVLWSLPWRCLLPLALSLVTHCLLIQERAETESGRKDWPWWSTKEIRVSTDYDVPGSFQWWHLLGLVTKDLGSGRFIDNLPWNSEWVKAIEQTAKRSVASEHELSGESLRELRHLRLWHNRKSGFTFQLHSVQSGWFWEKRNNSLVPQFIPV